MGKDARGMILYIDLEHRILAKHKPDYYAYVQEKRARTRANLEEILRRPCRLVHYTDVASDDFDVSEFQLIVMSGHNSGFEHYSDQGLKPIRDWLANPPCPIFTICGSFQLMVEVHGGGIGPIGERLTGKVEREDPILPRSMIGENGFCRIEKLDTAIPPFGEMPDVAFMQEHHFWEVKQFSDAFILCARTEVCECQALVHRSLPLAGVQFHPEDYDESHTDGLALLRAVWAWAKLSSVEEMEDER